MPFVEHDIGLLGILEDYAISTHQPKHLVSLGELRSAMKRQAGSIFYERDGNGKVVMTLTGKAAYQARGANGGRQLHENVRLYKVGKLETAKVPAVERKLGGCRDGANIMHNGGAAYKDYQDAVKTGADRKATAGKKRKAEESADEIKKKGNTSNVGKHSAALGSGEFVSEKSCQIELRVDGVVIPLDRDTFTVKKPGKTVVGPHNAITYIKLTSDVRNAIKGKVDGVTTDSEFNSKFGPPHVNLSTVHGKHGVKITAIKFC